MFSISNNGDLANEFVLFDDFFKLDTASTTGGWAVVNDGTTGSNAVVDRKGGWVNIVTAASADNDYHYLTSQGEHFLFDATSPIVFQAKVRLTEGNTDDANIVIGLTDTVTAGILVNDGAGVATSFDGALWYKVDGGTSWKFTTSNASAQTTQTPVAFTSGSDYVLGFVYSPMDGVTGKVTPFCNGVFYTPHTITISGLEEMHAILGVKAGGTSAETLGVDYIYARQDR